MERGLEARVRVALARGRDSHREHTKRTWSDMTLSGRNTISDSLRQLVGDVSKSRLLSVSHLGGHLIFIYFETSLICVRMFPCCSRKNLILVAASMWTSHKPFSSTSLQRAFPSQGLHHFRGLDRSVLVSGAETVSYPSHHHYGPLSSMTAPWAVARLAGSYVTETLTADFSTTDLKKSLAAWMVPLWPIESCCQSTLGRTRKGKL